MELMPEEALYLLERGSLQIWVRSNVYGEVGDAKQDQDISDDFDDERQGFEDATEMSVMEGYGRFIGMDGLSLERYQVGGRESI
jgi:tRNA-splicing endonuclease subunit Sen54